jgi:hypothetical protein
MRQNFQNMDMLNMDDSIDDVLRMVDAEGGRMPRRVFQRRIALLRGEAGKFDGDKVNMGYGSWFWKKGGQFRLYPADGDEEKQWVEITLAGYERLLGEDEFRRMEDDCYREHSEPLHGLPFDTFFWKTLRDRDK